MFDSFAKRFQKLASLFLRFGIGIVFLLFGIKKLLNPGQSTAEIQLLINFDLADAAAMNFYLGLIEVIIALAFFVGLKVRVTALVASIFLLLFFSSFLVRYGLSINPDLYRDVGLLGGTLALFLLGGGAWSLDELLTRHREKKDE